MAQATKNIETNETKTEFVTRLLASNESYQGQIDQTLYDQMKEALMSQYKLKRGEAQRALTMALKQLYVAKV